MTAPALKGAMLALLAAALFGVSTPLVQLFGAGLGPFTTAALLYAGAAVIGAVLKRPIEREARLMRSDRARPGPGRAGESRVGCDRDTCPGAR